MVKISDYPVRHGIIYGFSQGDPNFISDVMRDLRLRSPLDFWLWVSHCTKQLKMSEPTVDFIIMLDMLRSARRTKLPERIGEFNCSDEVQMRTYADLISKLYDAHPEIRGPFETERFLSAARDYLACCDIEGEDELIFASCKGDSVRKAIESGCRVRREKRMGDVTFAFGEKVKKNGRCGKVNNVICVLQGTEDSAQAFLLNETVSGAVLKASKIENSLIETLLDFSHGLEIVVYGTEGMTYPMAQVCAGLAGNYLVEIAQSDLYELQMIGAGHLVSVSPVAYVRKKKAIKFVFAQGSYSMNPEFLFEVLLGASAETVSVAQAEPLTAPVFEGTAFESSPDGYYLSDNIRTGCAYYDGAAAVVSAVSKAVAAGYAPDRIHLTNLITFDENHASGNLPSKLVSHTLGLYRAQMELCTPDACSTVEAGDADRVHVIAKGMGERKDSRARCGTVYLASPPLSHEGFPHYGELRRLFRFVSGAVTTGKCRAEAIGADGAKAALGRLCGDDTPISADNVRFVPGAFLLLCEEKIDGLETLGSFGGEPQSMVQD